MNSEVKFFVGVIGVTMAIIVGAAVFFGQAPAVNNTAIDLNSLVKNDSQVLGAKDSKVTIVEFSDFQCPACKQAQPAVEQIFLKYTDKIRFVYRNYPLPAHEYAQGAAQAAEAAGMQGKFWEMHKILFEKSPDLSKEKLFEYAKSLNLDMDKFAVDYDSDAVRQRILNDVTDGGKVGIQATPTFFINGTKFEGMLSVEQFSKEIDSRL